MVDKKGGIKEGNVSGFLSLTYSTSQDHWDFRSCLIECVARTSDDVKYELTKCGTYIDTLKEWLEEMKLKSSHESLVFKVLESLIELPVRFSLSRRILFLKTIPLTHSLSLPIHTSHTNIIM